MFRPHITHDTLLLGTPHVSSIYRGSLLYMLTIVKHSLFIISRHQEHVQIPYQECWKSKRHPAAFPTLQNLEILGTDLKR